VKITGSFLQVNETGKGTAIKFLHKSMKDKEEKVLYNFMKPKNFPIPKN
jgi:hypothetical protein